MTGQETDTGPGEEERQLAGDAPEETGSSRRGRRAGRRTAPAASPLWRWGFPLALVVVVVWSGALLVEGLRTVLNSEEGDTRIAVTDPEAPGFEAFVEQTWSLLALTEDDDGALVHAAVVSVADRQAGGGTVLLVPPDLEAYGCPGNPCTLSGLHATAGEEGTRRAVGELLGSDVTAAVVLARGDWSVLVEPVSPLSIGPGGATVAEGEVLDLLGPAAEGTRSLLDGQEALWVTWLAALVDEGVTVADLDGVSPELARVIEVLVRGEATVTGSPWRVSEGHPSSPSPDLGRLAAGMFPYPIPVGNADRPTVRLLNGTGDRSVDAVARRAVREAGFEIAVVGNFRNFDAIQTRVLYRDPTLALAAAELAGALRAGVILDEAASPVADLTVVVGADFSPGVG